MLALPAVGRRGWADGPGVHAESPRRDDVFALRRGWVCDPPRGYRCHPSWRSDRFSPALLSDTPAQALEFIVLDTRPSREHKLIVYLATRLGVVHEFQHVHLLKRQRI